MFTWFFLTPKLSDLVILKYSLLFAVFYYFPWKDFF